MQKMVKKPKDVLTDLNGLEFERDPEWAYACVTLVGTTPILFNPKRDLSERDAKDPAKVAASKVHRSKDGKSGIPTRMLREGFLDGGHLVTYKGMVKFSKSASKTEPRTSLVSGVLEIREEFLPFFDHAEMIVESHALVDVDDLLDAEEGLMLDSQSFPAMSSQGRRTAQVAHRPRFPAGWKVRLTLGYDVSDKNVTKEKIQELIKLTGKKIGLGSYRIKQRGWYGKFRILEWQDL